MSTDVLERDSSGDLERAAPRRRRWMLLTGCVLVVAMLVSGALWWYVGGSHLSAAGGGLGTVVQVGEEASFGIYVSKDNSGDLRLDSVSARLSPGATVKWSIYQAPPGGPGFGSWHGPLAPQYTTVPVAGFHRVPSGSPWADGSTWIVGTVVAATPGVYRLSDVTVAYHSGWRTRTTSSQALTCVLVYPSNTTYEKLVAAADPLVAQREECLKHQ